MLVDNNCFHFQGTLIDSFIATPDKCYYSSRSEVTNRVVFGLITWFAGPGKSCRELYIYIFSINLLAFYHQRRSLIGYATHYLFCDR